MSARYIPEGPKRKMPKWGIAVIAVIVIGLLICCIGKWWSEKKPSTSATDPSSAVVTAPEPVLDQIQDADMYLNDRMKIVNVASYTGAFVEDGSNEVVSGVLMLMIENVGEEAIQYAEITLPTNNGEAKFALSTLPAGESVVLLEQTRMKYTGNEEIGKASCQNLALFTAPLSLHQDQLKMQILNGAINVINISEEDIDGDIVIYYKNAAADLYYGGITYRIRIEGGMKADEIKQITASHFDQAGSKIMFVTVG